MPDVSPTGLSVGDRVLVWNDDNDKLDRPGTVTKVGEVLNGDPVVDVQMDTGESEPQIVDDGQSIRPWPMIRLGWQSDTHAGQIDCPVLPSEDPTDRALIERAARRAFYSLIHAGYGDIPDMKVFYNGEWIPMDPQKGEGTQS